MKTKIFILLFLILSFNAYSQWLVQSPYPQANDVYDIAIIDPNTVIGTSNWMCTVFKTTNGGANWTVFDVENNREFKILAFPNSLTGYAVGGAMTNKPLKTTNGGVNWFPLNSANDTTKWAIGFYDVNTGWIAGVYGFIMKTTDGGNTWVSQTNPAVTNKTLKGIYPIDADNVVIAGSSKTIVRTTDGGNNWISVNAPFVSGTDELRYVTFLNANTGILCGARQRIARTTNGGVS
ncbi:MAG: hypothetical protein FJ216_05240 [Ignavibacteria bacterium]|nr:hypothetical protein [Ignavibacteria bacterium]